MPNETYTGTALEAALASGKFDESPLTINGMIKASAKPKHVAFALGNCDNWVDLPVDMIDSAERLGSVPCKEHMHPYFKIILKMPKDDSAKVLASILAATQIAQNSAIPSSPMSISARAGTTGLRVGVREQVQGAPQGGSPFTVAQARPYGPGGFGVSQCCVEVVYCGDDSNGNPQFCCRRWEDCPIYGRPLFGSVAFL